jgi:hypothetical protein
MLKINTDKYCSQPEIEKLQKKFRDYKDDKFQLQQSIQSLHIADFNLGVLVHSPNKFKPFDPPTFLTLQVRDLLLINSCRVFILRLDLY